METQIKFTKSTNNEYKYNGELFEKQLYNFIKKQKNTTNCNLGEISHVDKDTFVNKDNTIFINSQILNTSKSKTLKQTIGDNHNISIEPIGDGNIDENGTYLDYNIYGFKINI